MEGLYAINLRANSSAIISAHKFSTHQPLNPLPPKITFLRSMPQTHMLNHSPLKQFSVSPIKAQQVEINGGLASVCDPTISDEDLLKVKEWEIAMLQEELAASQGISIRRRPPSGPPPHYIGPFEFRLQNEGKTPHNILEEIVWHKNVEVSQVLVGESIVNPDAQ